MPAAPFLVQALLGLAALVAVALALAWVFSNLLDEPFDEDALDEKRAEGE